MLGGLLYGGDMRSVDMRDHSRSKGNQAHHRVVSYTHAAREWFSLISVGIEEMSDGTASRVKG